MENKCPEKNIFESGFDSFDLDDAFLNKIDVDLKKNCINEKTFVDKHKLSDKEKEKENQKLEKKTQFYDSPLFIEDFNDSDFFDFGSKEKRQLLKSENDHEDDSKWNNGFISCLSPILGGKCSKRLNLSSSTPERRDSVSSTKGNNDKPNESLMKDSEDGVVEVDLFEDWDLDDKKETQKETVTLSQALELIKEAESEKLTIEDSLNESINLLTGEIVGGDVGVMFDESFTLPKSAEKHADNCSDDSVIVNEVVIGHKPPAAQKLNFEHEKVSYKSTESKGMVIELFSSSDEDFDFCTQDLIKKSKKAPCFKPKLNDTKSASASPLKDSDLNESSDSNIYCSNKRKCPKIIFESDTTEESPSPKFLRQNRRKAKEWKDTKDNCGREFLDVEAEISDCVEVSSDEGDEDGEYDKSFLDEASYFSQNYAANMTAKYLTSVKAVDGRGTFKIPAAKPYNPADVFSQIPEDANNDYEFDSFCVKDVEEEPKTDLSDLEIAERILEMDRKKKKKKRSQKIRN